MMSEAKVGAVIETGSVSMGNYTIHRYRVESLYKLSSDQLESVHNAFMEGYKFSVTKTAKDRNSHGFFVYEFESTSATEGN